MQFFMDMASYYASFGMLYEFNVMLQNIQQKSQSKSAIDNSGMADDIAYGVCFVAGTLILTAEGTKLIECISKSDIVIATDPETGETAEKEVVEVYVNESSELVQLTINGEEITTTPTHPFYVPQKGWTFAIELRAGDILVLVNGEYVTVEAVQHEILESPVTVYNSQVADFHTYYVGEQSVHKSVVRGKKDAVHVQAVYNKIKKMLLLCRYLSKS